MNITYNGILVTLNGSLVSFTNNTPIISSGFIYVGGEVINGNTVRKYDSDGNLLTSLTSTNRTRGIDTDLLGNLVIVGDYNTTNQAANFIKFDGNGNTVFAIPTLYTLNKVKTDSLNDIVIVGGPSNQISAGKTVTTEKYSSTGSLLWSVNHGVLVSNVTFDSQNNVITAGNRSSGNFTTRKYNSSGTLLWSRDHGAGVNDVETDSSDNIIAVGARNSVIDGINNTTRKYNSSGDLLWSVDHGTTVSSVGVDSQNNIITSGFLVNGVTTRKYDSNGNLLWSIDTSYVNTRSVTIDGNDNILIAADSGSSNAYLLKYNPNGELIWSVLQGNLTYDVAVSNL